MKYTASFILVIIFWLIFYFLPQNSIPEFKSFLTLATFLFAIFIGFFISRQSNRYNETLRLLAKFDGTISALYRLFNHSDKKKVEKFVKIVKAEYSLTLDSKSWTHTFLEKTSFITDTHSLLSILPEKTRREDYIFRVGLGYLGSLQLIRKEIIVITKERIPLFQWIVIFILGFSLIFAITTLPSTRILFSSLLKAAFCSAIFIIIYLLYKFNNLSFFEKVTGGSTGRDVLDIIDGKK